MLFLAQPIIALQSNSELSELSKLKAENFQLKAQLGQCKVTVDDRDKTLLEIKLSDDQNKLVEEFRKELKADKNDTFNWQTLKFEKPKKDDKKDIK